MDDSIFQFDVTGLILHKSDANEVENQGIPQQAGNALQTNNEAPE